MKDKIIVAIVCAFFISMVWISSTSNTTFSNNAVIGKESLSIPAEDTTMEFIDYDASKISSLMKQKYKQKFLL